MMLTHAAGQTACRRRTRASRAVLKGTFCTEPSVLTGCQWQYTVTVPNFDPSWTDNMHWLTDLGVTSHKRRTWGLKGGICIFEYLSECPKSPVYEEEKMWCSFSIIISQRSWLQDKFLLFTSSHCGPYFACLLKNSHFSNSRCHT